MDKSYGAFQTFNKQAAMTLMLKDHNGYNLIFEVLPDDDLCQESNKLGTRTKSISFTVEPTPSKIQYDSGVWMAVGVIAIFYGIFSVFLCIMCVRRKCNKGVPKETEEIMNEITLNENRVNQTSSQDQEAVTAESQEVSNSNTSGPTTHQSYRYFSILLIIAICYGIPGKNQIKFSALKILKSGLKNTSNYQISIEESQLKDLISECQSFQSQIFILSFAIHFIS